MKHLDDTVLQGLKKLVSDQIGFCLREGDIEIFRKTLFTRMKLLTIAEPEEYLSFLKSDTAESRREWEALITAITTGESYFFRDKGHFFLLQNTILPELIKDRETSRSLRIWCAGCSTGEEPYSVAMLLDMLLPDKSGWSIFIVGTDINGESLKKAERGIYSDWSFRMVDKTIKEKYFRRHQDGWEIDGNIKKMVRFHYGNLMEAAFYSQNSEMRDMDIIICRNVFIYFNKESVALVFRNFINTLHDGGQLITGHGELHGQDLMRLRQIIYPEAVLYKKTLASGQPAPEITRSPEVKGKKKVLPLQVPTASKPPIAVPESRNKMPSDPKREIEALIKKGHCADAADKAEEHLYTCREKCDILCRIAREYANAGDYTKAEGACRKAMVNDADSADPYFILAHIAEARGNDEGAKDCFRKAIYLNPSFIAAYCELGGLYEKEKDITRARKVRTTAIELLTALPSQAPVKPYDITAGELLGYIRYLTGGKDDHAVQPAIKRDKIR